MHEYKFKNFDFREFMDFVLNLADFYGLGQVRFIPNGNKEYFDEHQLTHISPSRNVDDKRGFAWAWKESSKTVREISFDQFSKDETKKINVTINLDTKIIRLNSIEGLSQAIVEDLIKKRFSNGQALSDIQIEKLQVKLTILNFFIALFFSFSFTILYAITKINGIYFYWKPLIKYFILFFSVIFGIIYVLLPIIEIIKKVGFNLKKLISELSSDFMRTSKLNQLIVVLAISSFVFSIIQCFI